MTNDGTTKTREELLVLIRTDPGSLEGIAESQWIDFKREPHLKPDGKTTEQHRFELAKDVTAMANSGGGLIVWGVAESGDQSQDVARATELVPIPAKCIDQSQVAKVLYDWVFPSHIQFELHEHGLASGGSIWTLEVLPPGPMQLPYLVVREWPPGKDEKRPGRGHFTMYRRVGTDNFLVPPEEVYLWLREGYQRQMLPNGASPNGRELTAATKDSSLDSSSDRNNPPLDIAKSADEALEELVRLLDIPEKAAFLIVQLAPIQDVRLDRFFGYAAEALESTLERFQTIRQGGFSAFSRSSSVLRVESNALYRGILQDSGVCVYPSGLTTLICGQRLLTWAYERSGVEGKIPINPRAMPEFVLEACRFFVNEVVPRTGVDSGHFTWRVGMKEIFGDISLALPRGNPDRSLMQVHWRFTPPRTAKDFMSAFVMEASRDAGRLAFSIMREIYHRFGYEPDAIPFSKDGAVEEESIRAQ